tara:strand:+ start:1445 stop:2080 length:636 start_codon:yes stop_codon:yes gene_type:complete
MEIKNYLALKFKVMKILKIISLFFLLTLNAYAVEDKNRIAVLVNDNVITNYDIEQRIKIFAIINQVQITPENGQFITNKIVDELVDNLLKLEKIEEYKISVDNSELNRHENQYFEKLGLDKEKVFELMKINGIDVNQFYSVLYNEIAWQTLIGKLYYRVTSVSQSEIEELINKNPDISLKLAEQIIMDKQLSLKSSKMLRDLRAEATIEYR